MHGMFNNNNNNNWGRDVSSSDFHINLVGTSENLTQKVTIKKYASYIHREIFNLVYKLNVLAF